MARKHLRQQDRDRIRILIFDANKTKAEVAAITGYTLNQIRTALSYPTVRPRSGRPAARPDGKTQEVVVDGTIEDVTS